MPKKENPFAKAPRERCTFYKGIYILSSLLRKAFPILSFTFCMICLFWFVLVQHYLQESW